MRTATLALVFVLLGSTLPAQRPDTGPEKGLSRLAFEATLLGGPPAATAVEINGVVHDLAKLRARILAEGELPGGQPFLPERLMVEELVRGMLQDDLVRRQAWLDDEACEEAYASYAEPYDKTPFTVAVIATKFKRYPDLETFRQRWRVMHSFTEALPADALTGEPLAAEAVASRDLLTDTAIEVELWLHPAAPGADGRGEFTMAGQLAQQTLAVLAADRSGAEDEPASVLPEGVEYTRLPKIGFNPLRTKLGEGEVTSLLREGVTEAVFRAEPGELLGPLRGPAGIYVARVVKRHETGRRIDVADARSAELVRELLIQRRFRQWIDEVFAKAVIRAHR